ncbi:MAG TPA: replicative DNA helicase [Candidatus Saccharimonadales bacterium]|nr:replicative DNA helicase [Candidatus Saccharimonadales bacterium]
MDSGINSQQLPHNIEAEASLLGALLIDSDAIVKVADLLTAGDFFDPRHAHIYEAMAQLYEKRRSIDVLTLADQLKTTGMLDAVGGPSYLAELTNFVPTASHAEQYADIVAQKALRRRLIQASQDMTRLGLDESKELKSLIEDAESRLFEVSGQHVKQNIVSLEAILAASFDRLDELHKDKGKIRGVATGYKDLDNVLAGLQKSDLIVLAARPSMGKTALALNLAHNVAVQSKEPVLIFSLEMSKEQLVDRLLAMESGVDAWALRTGNLTDSDFEKLAQAMGTLSEAQIYIDDSPGITVSDLRTKARREAHLHDIGLIIVDYLQLMSGGGRYYSGDGNRVQEISEISRGLKGIARELNVPLMALSQLSRSVESRSPQIPQLADLRESGCLAGDTPVYLPDTGKYIPIRELVDNPKAAVSSLRTDTYKIETMPVERAFCTGKKAVYRLTTKSGRSIRATANHKFLTVGGWKRLDQLDQTDFIALPRFLTHSGSTETPMTEAEIGLLGHLIGDGCTLPRHAIQYTTKDHDIALIVSDLATTAFGPRVHPRIQRERTWYQVYLASAYRLTRGKRNPVSEWLSNLDIFGLRSYEKRVPALVFEQSKDLIATFLRHLWATDGCVKLGFVMGKPCPTIYYASSSQQLARDVQSLLLRLGIIATLRRVSQGKRGRDQFHVAISGHDDLVHFVKLVGAAGKSKKDHIQLISAYLDYHPGNTNRDIIPKTVWKDYAVPAMQTLGVTTRQLQASLGNAYCGSTLYKSNLSRQRTALVAQAVQSENLQKLSVSEVYWDRIASIRADGVAEVFDLTISKTHNFVAADIIVHNSIEQDSDVVAFIYREEYYNPESERKNMTDILIKKHRNGPTSNIELYFDKARQRFRSVDTKHQDPFTA